MLNPNFKIKLDKPLKLGNMRINRRLSRKSQKVNMNPLGRPLTIIFCLPGTPFSNKFLIGWTQIVQYCMIHKIQLLVSNHLNSNVYYVRNQCLGGNVQSGVLQKPFGGKISYDYMMWIDSDQVFSVSDFEKLLSANKDIVSGLYLMDGGTRYATVQKWDKKFFKENGYFKFLDPEFVNEWMKKNDGKLMEVEYTGFGWILVKKGVFESLEYPWFRPIWEEFGKTSDGIPIKEFSSEDVGWCQTVLKKGFKIYIDPTVQVGHEKTINYILPEFQNKLNN
mgnify:CR=1 FL=1